MGEVLDMMQYLKAVQVNVTATIALIAALETAAPPNAPAAMQRALQALRTIRMELEAAFRAQQFAEAPTDPRRYDLLLDRSWSALIERLRAWDELPTGTYPEQERAERLLTLLAPDGLAALKRPYREQWSILKARLDEVHAQQLDDDLVELAGKVFVDDVRLRFEDYGRVLGLTQARPTPETTRQSELLRTARQRMVEYVIQVFATIDPNDPDTARAARDTLRPLAEAREAALAARKGRGSNDTPQPEDSPVSPHTAQPASPLPNTSPTV
jgi:hypothetical protein